MCVRKTLAIVALPILFTEIEAPTAKPRPAPTPPAMETAAAPAVAVMAELSLAQTVTSWPAVRMVLFRMRASTVLAIVLIAAEPAPEREIPAPLPALSAAAMPIPTTSMTALDVAVTFTTLAASMLEPSIAAVTVRAIWFSAKAPPTVIPAPIPPPPPIAAAAEPASARITAESEADTDTLEAVVISLPLLIFASVVETMVLLDPAPAPEAAMPAPAPPPAVNPPAKLKALIDPVLAAVTVIALAFFRSLPMIEFVISALVVWLRGRPLMVTAPI